MHKTQFIPGTTQNLSKAAVGNVENMFESNDAIPNRQPLGELSIGLTLISFCLFNLQPEQMLALVAAWPTNWVWRGMITVMSRGPGLCPPPPDLAWVSDNRNLSSLIAPRQAGLSG